MKLLLLLMLFSSQVLAQTTWVSVAQHINPDGTKAEFFLDSSVAKCQGRNILKVVNLQTDHGKVHYLTVVEVFPPMTRLPFPYPAISDGPSSPLRDAEGRVVANGYVSQNLANPSEPLLAFPDSMGYLIYRALCSSS